MSQNGKWHSVKRKYRKQLRRLHIQFVKYAQAYFMRFKSTEHMFMVVVAIFIGLLGGFGAVGIQFAIKLFQKLFWSAWTLSTNYFYELPWHHKLLAPAIGAFLVGLIVQYFSREAKGHGVPEVMEAIALRNGVIRPRVVVAKLLASSLYIGAGGSVGREGPVIQIGSSVGSTIGQFLRVNPQRMKTFVACGAAAGIAAAFNAPVAGALFSVEVILGDFGVPQFSPIVISSVVATVVSRSFLGDFPAFAVPPYHLVSPFELIPYAMLGILAGLVAVMFIRTLYRFETFFDHLKTPEYVKTVIGGLLVGLIGIFIPHIYGVGYDTMDRALQSDMMWQWLLLLIFVKTLATSISLGSGGSGGVFAPSLFLGTMTGGFFGAFVHEFLPNTTAESGAYALVGMGAVVAAATHAPITAILIIFEMTNDYKIILPLMISTIIATLISTKLQKESIYTIKLVRRGIDIFKGKDINVLHGIKVRDVVEQDYQTVQEGLPFRRLVKLIWESPKPEFFVINRNGDFEGVITLAEVRQALQDEEVLGDIVVAKDLAISDIPTISAEDTLDNALKIMAQRNIDFLPVVDSRHPNKLVGQIRWRDVMEAYNREVTRLDMTSELVHSVKLLDRAKTLEFVDGYALAEIPCPGEFVHKSIRELDLRARYNIQVIMIKRPGPRQKEVTLVPNPSEVLQVGDRLIVVGPEKAVEKVKNM